MVSQFPFFNGSLHLFIPTHQSHTLLLQFCLRTNTLHTLGSSLPIYHSVPQISAGPDPLSGRSSRCCHLKLHPTISHQSHCAHTATNTHCVQGYDNFEMSCITQSVCEHYLCMTCCMAVSALDLFDPLTPSKHCLQDIQHGHTHTRIETYTPQGRHHGGTEQFFGR